MEQGTQFPKKILPTWVAILSCLLSGGHFFKAAAAIDWPTLGFTQVVTNSFNHPVCITHAGDGSQRLFIVQQSGFISIIQNSNFVAVPFLNITNRVTSAGAEQGLLGLAFPPGFPAVNHFYVDYTIATNNSVVVSRFQLSSTNANVADTNSEQIILTIPKPYNNHNAGQLAFGPDGYLYIGIGDGGSEGDPKNLGQYTSNLLSKILRIDVESGVSPYAIPANNPYVSNTNYAPETWAYGLRNPWRFSFDRTTGDLYIGDVGQNLYEEIDFQPTGSAGGQNYGWRIMEGPTNYIVPTGFTNFASLTLPVAWYNHNSLPTDLAGAVIGGYVYRGPSQPRMDGMYFYGDFSSGWMWGLKQDSGQWQSLTLTNPADGQFHFAMSTFGEDDLGQLYLANYNSGLIYQIYDSQQVSPPMFSISSGTTINSNLVAVTTGSPNAEIHWTTNGIDPTLSDPLVPTNGMVQVYSGITNKARAFRADLSPSLVTASVYTLRVATPVLNPGSGAVTNPTPVTITTVTPNASIYYRTDSGTPTTNSFLYTGPVILRAGTILTAIGACPGFTNSSVASGSYTMNQTGGLTVTPTSGQVTYGTQISISCATPGSTILYTLDGTNPTSNSLAYSNSITITRDTTLIAVGTFLGYANSGILTNNYKLPQSPPPVFLPSVGPLTNGAQISITSASSNAIIYYTLDGSLPSTNSAIYAGPLTFTNQMTLSAKVLPFNMDLSNPMTNFYGLQIMEHTVVTTLAGQIAPGYSNAVGANAMFSGLLGICLDNLGNLYVADSQNNVVREISSSGNVTTFAGNGTNGIQLGTATNAEFTTPTGVCVDIAGNIYVGNADSCDSVLKVDANKNVTLWSSVGSLMRNCTSVPTLWFLAPQPGAATYIYSGFLGMAIRVSASSVDELSPPSSPGWGAHVGVSLDSASNVYAATGFEVWITPPVPHGNVTLLAGSIQGYSDQVGTNALFQGPQGTAVDAATNVIVTDLTSVRKIHPNGQVTTVAGTGISGYRNGPGAVAQFNGAAGLCIDTNGNIYITDNGNNCIRKISPDTAGIGIADDWQIAHFGYIGIDPNADPDHDGMSNYQEFWAGTDPLDPNSALRIQTVSLITNGSPQISWQTVSGKAYTVQYSTDLIAWINLGATVNGNGLLMTVTDPGTVSQNGGRYYRIALAGF